MLVCPFPTRTCAKELDVHMVRYRKWNGFRGFRSSALSSLADVDYIGQFGIRHRHEKPCAADKTISAYDDVWLDFEDGR